MSRTAITVENLSKCYRIGAHARQPQTRGGSLKQAALSPLAYLRRTLRAPGEEEIFWALRDISFEVKHGEAVGIIGRNGAGKSTLLKLLSRITEPTSGRAVIKGRVGSLLEVGTGFHPELTGRENIYLNGTILGMKRYDIQRRFDEIVDFSGVEKFIDTPVKHYSSGMYVRLAFAVAAHLQPDILIIDEVLSVGDSAFQKKCIGKMENVASEGRTVLFVSHSMVTVQQLCQSGLLLNEGKITFRGDIGSTIKHYAEDVQLVQTASLADRRDRRGSQRIKFTRVGLFDASGNEQKRATSGQDIFIRFYYESNKPMHGATVNVAFNVTSSLGYLLTNLNSLDVGKSNMDVYEAGFLQCKWPRFSLRSGLYDCTLFCEVNGDIADWVQSAFSIEVDDGDFFNTGKIIGREQGDILVSYDWTSHPGQES